jgi:hypothetical protein
VDLTPVLGQPDVLLMFESQSNFGNNVYIDDVNIAMFVGVDEHANGAFRVFPNPSNGLVSVLAGDVDGTMDVRVVGIDGALVHSARWQATPQARLDLDLSGVAAGSYVVVLTNGTGHSHRVPVVMQ